MKRDALEKSIRDVVQEYIDYSAELEPNLHVRINPVSFDVALVRESDMLGELGDNDEAVEDAAGAQGAEYETAADFQVSLNPDFYPVSRFIAVSDDDSKQEVNTAAVAEVASNY